MAAFALPTEPTPKRSSLAEQTILVYGKPKIGKSTLAAGFDGALFLATEQGLGQLTVAQTYIDSWETMLAACGAIAGGKHPYRTVAIDTVGIAYDLCSDFVCKKFGWSHPSDGTYGKGSSAVKQEFRRVLTKLAALPSGLVMIAHERSEKDERTGNVQCIPALPGGARDVIVGMADLILYATVAETTDAEGKPVRQRVLRTRPTLSYEAGSRIHGMPDPIPLHYADLEAAVVAALTDKETTR